MPTVVGDTSPTPIRQTRDQLVTQVLRYVRAPSHSEATALAQDEINNAIRRLNMRTWNWSLESDDITLVASTDAYTIAGTFKAPRIAELLNGSSQYVNRLSYLDPTSFDTKYTDRTGDGSPEAYTVFNFNDALQVTLSCPPSSSYVASYPTLRLRYWTRLNVFSTNANFPGPSEAEEFVVWYARYAVALQTDPTKANAALRERDNCWALLVRDDNEHHFHDWEH